jgi:MFS transporter, FSR family, fosmidomycin resistance protein
MEYATQKTGWRLVFSGLLPYFILAHFFHHFVNSLPIPLLPLIRSDFALDYTQAGWTIGAFQISYGLAQVPGGWLADRIGPRLMLAIGVCGGGLAGFLAGISPTFMLLAIFFILMGVTGGGYHPAASPMISAAVKPENQGRALGLHVVGGSASNVVGPLLAAAIATYFGWRGSFIGFSLPILAFGIFFYFLLRKREIEKKSRVQLSPSSSAVDSSNRSSLRPLVIFIFLTTSVHAVLFSINTFIPLYLVDHFGYNKETVGVFYALTYSAGLWVSPLGGYLSDRLGRVRVVVAVCLAVAPVVYLLNWVSSTWAISILLVVIGVNIYVRMPVSESYIIRHTSPHNRSLILGIYFFGGMEGGGVLAPGVGYLIDHLGFHYTFTIAAAVILFVTLVGMLLLKGIPD